MNDFNAEPTTNRARVAWALAFAATAGVFAACVIARPTSPAAPVAQAARVAAPPQMVAARQGAVTAAVVQEPPPPPEPPPIELPRGGRTLFPDYRLVGFCGTPGAPELGSLQGN